MGKLRMFLVERWPGFGGLGLAPVGLEREEGQTLAEYALILALIAVLVIGAVLFLSGSLQGLFSSIGSQI
jgi:pilus assembly protein Flp/PilA